MLDAVLDLIPVARVGFVGVYRDEETLEPVEYYCKLPGDLAERDVLVLDPMLATGGSASEALRLCKRRGAVRTSLLCVVAAPAGVDRDRRRPPRRGGVHRGGRPRAERAGLHPPGPRRRRRPPVRHPLDERAGCLGSPGRTRLACAGCVRRTTLDDTSALERSCDGSGPQVRGTLGRVGAVRSPRTIAPRALDHRHSSGRAQSPARTGFASDVAHGRGQVCVGVDDLRPVPLPGTGGRPGRAGG